jgi:S-DNA-T family DNA segregation ATPase FtsK/SpoIIIE
MGRAVGIVLVAVTQRPSAAALGSLDARTQMTARVALGVVEARDGELILGGGRLGAGWRAERLSGPGYFLVLLPGQHEVPRPARAYLLTDEAVRAAAARHAGRRPALDAASAGAAETPQQPAQGLVTTSTVDPDEALLAELRNAPHGGLTADELAHRIGRRRTWVYERLSRHARAGRAVRRGPGRWAGAGPHPRRAGP